MDANAADTFPSVDDCHALAEFRALDGSVMARRAASYDDKVVIGLQELPLAIFGSLHIELPLPVPTPVGMGRGLGGGVNRGVGRSDTGRLVGTSRC